MVYTDVHTHFNPARPARADVRRIVSLRFPSETAVPAGLFSAGVHPWDAAAVSDADVSDRLARFVVSQSAVAIGECGIDRFCGVPLERQMKVFAAQTELAEMLSLPLVIHAVRASADVVLLHRRMKPSSVWIVHGFRGKPRQAEELLAEGIFLSVGLRFNPELPKVLGCDRLLVESDTADVPLEAVYGVVAAAWGMERDVLAACVGRTFDSLFGGGAAIV